MAGDLEAKFKAMSDFFSSTFHFRELDFNEAKGQTVRYVFAELQA